MTSLFDTPNPAGLPARDTLAQRLNGAASFSFITDHPHLRTARKDCALARLAWEQATKSHQASERLHRRYVLAKARLMGLEGEHG